MNKFILGASAAFAAIAMAPAANASISIACPYSGPGLATCNFDESIGTGTFGNSYVGSQSFTDRFQLTLTSLYTLSVTMTNTVVTGGPISFSSAQLLDSAFVPLAPSIAFNAAPTTFDLFPGVYYLEFIGHVTSRASYGGTIDVAPLPEPATWGMMVIGLGVAGLAMRRRATKISFA